MFSGVTEVEMSDNKDKTKRSLKLNKYSGYVYDAVWLYAYALDALVKKQTNIQNFHSERIVTQFVNIIKNINFNGVTGKINFKGRPSRLSNIRIIQWLKNTSNEIFEQEIGLYVPDYEAIETTDKKHTHGKTFWNDRKIHW